MLVLVACEYSGRVREAFKARGHDAWSCDLLDTDISGQHLQGNVLDILDLGWDLMIAHPPCRYLALSASRLWKQNAVEQAQAIEFVKALWAAPIEKIAIENPVGALSTKWQKPSQYVQPWMFGDGFVKKTCWWLKGLPLLQPTNIVDGRIPGVYKMGETKDRAKKRSLTYMGMAAAMAAQWG